MADIEEELCAALARYPYDIALDERGEAFDGLARRFDAPSLVRGIAREKTEGLLPFLEAAQASRALSDPPNKVDGPLLWLEAEAHYENDFTESTFDALSKGPRSLLVAEEPPLSLSPSRYEALAAQFREVGGVVCPLSSSRALALDLLLARLLGLAVAGIAPLPLAPALGEGSSLPDLMVVAQTLSVVVVPRTVNATFWTMAAHAQIVDAERIGAKDGLADALARAISAPARPARKTTPKRGATLEGALARATATGLAGWQRLTFPPLVAPGLEKGEETRTIEELRAENEALKAELRRLRGDDVTPA